MVRETTPEDSEREDEIELLFNNVLHKCRVTVRNSVVERSENLSIWVR